MSRSFHSCLDTFCTLFVAQTFSRSLLHCVNDYIGWVKDDRYSQMSLNHDL